MYRNNTWRGATEGGKFQYKPQYTERTIEIVSLHLSFLKRIFSLVEVRRK